MRNLLFALDEPPFNVGDDLIARNIQRGRDHGLPSYAAHYKHQIPEASPHNFDCWGRKPEEIPHDIWGLLQQVYHHPHHIDLFTGGMCETPNQGAVLGKTFSRMVGTQFAHLKFGDRFFYTHIGQFLPAEYQHIRKRNLADIICENTELTKVPENPFRYNSPTKQCVKTSKLNINEFSVQKVPPGFGDI